MQTDMNKTFTVRDVIDRLYQEVLAERLDPDQPIYAGIEGTDNFTPLVNFGIEHGEAYLTVHNPFPDTDTPEHRKADEILREAAHAAPVKPNKAKRIRVGESKKTLPNGKAKTAPQIAHLYREDGTHVNQKFDWSAVDWSKRTSVIAAEMGTTQSYVSRKRRELAAANN